MPVALKLPKVQILLILIALYASAFITQYTQGSVRLLILAVGFVAVFDLLFSYITRHKVFIPYAGAVSALIITLLMSPAAAWYEIMLVAALASGSKFLFRPGHRQVVNPAALGLIGGSLILGQSLVLWWGITSGIIPTIIILSALLVAGRRLHRWYMIGSFLAVYGVLAFFLEGTLYALANPIILFFALVMLPEPLSSPVGHKRQILYGAFVAVAAQLLVVPSINALIPKSFALVDYLLLALLAGNMAFFRHK